MLHIGVVMNHRDTDRTPVDGGWVVWCDHCNKRFESKRSDASYCSAKCRMGAKREHEARLKYIASLASLGRQLRNKAAANHRSDLMYKAMLELQKDINAAVAMFEE